MPGNADPGPLQVMGIVNVTPDSFSDGGRFLDPDAAIEHGQALVAEGAAILDIGGESTRPGATQVPAEVEMERVVPVIGGLADRGARISVDTMKLPVAVAAIEAGASIVNDVSALRADPDLAALCADREVTVVLMHAGPPPHARPIDAAEVVPVVKAFLAERIEFALAAGIAKSRIWVDPGIGFGKASPEGNVELLRRVNELCDLGFPVLVGASRKSFIGRLDGSEAEDRLGGTLAASLVAAERGAAVLRVHDVAPLVQALRMTATLLERPRLWVPVDRHPISTR